MSLIAVPLLVFLMWPFHRHHVPAPQLPTVYIVLSSGEPIVPEKACTQDPSYGWQIVGPDGAVGFSTESCQEAFEDWQSQPANDRKQNRI